MPLDLLMFVSTFLGLRGDYLILDGTSWRSGKTKFHFLTLCVVYRDVAIPIFWRNLQKTGHSSTQERMELIRSALHRFDLSYSVLIADREYIGTAWFKYLLESDIDFIIRLKRGTYMEAVDQSEGRSNVQLCYKTRRSKVAGKVLGKSFTLEGMPLKIVVLKNSKENADDPLIYLLTSLNESARSVADKYRMRWKIEAFFRHVKTNGFSLEAMNLGTQSRCQWLMAIVVFAYVLSIKEGLETYRKVRVKNYANGSQEREKSVFRHGLNNLTRFCANLLTFCRHLFSELGNNKMPVPIMILENVQ